MTITRNLEAVREFYDRMDQHDAEAMLSFASDHVEWLDVPTGSRMRGKEGFRKSAQYWLNVFPDAQIEIRNIFGTDEFVVVEYLGRGTHQGPLKTMNGNFEGSGRRVEASFCDIIRLANGKIESGHSYYDLMTLLDQIGISMPLTPEARAA